MLNQPHSSFAYLIEGQASSLAASLVLPMPDSNEFCMRLSRFPVDGTETILDLHTSGSRVFVTVTRFLYSLRRMLQFSTYSKSKVITEPLIEISISECDGNDPLIREILSKQIFDIESNLSDKREDNHYFLFFTDSRKCISAGISNPLNKLNEQWIRLINRSYGTELVPPRRKSRKHLVVP